MNWTREMLVALALVVGVFLIQASCRCDKSPVPTPDVAVTTQPPGTLGVLDGSEGGQEPSPAWTPVLHLQYAEGLWGSKDAEEGWAEISSRESTIEKGDKWRSPYPWHLVLALPGEYAYDCGFHEELMDADGLIGWRLAWCEGGALDAGRRHARRVFFHKREAAVEFLGIEIIGLVKADFDRN